MRACLVVVALAAACAPADREEDPAEAAAEAPIPAAVEASVVALGSRAAGELATSLMSRLQATLAEQGAAGAVSFCSAEGLPLTAEASREAGFDIKRTSSKIRNPANRPDSLERAALDHFENRRPSGDSLPARFVQRTRGGDYRYYQPLRIQPFCVQCHGPADELAEGVADVLAEHYPDDEATGYAAGDFRGLIRVAIPASAVADSGP